MKGNTHRGELDILRRLDDLEREVFGGNRKGKGIAFKVPESVPVKLMGLGHFWRFPSPDANITGEYICDNCWICSDEAGAGKQCSNPTNYSKGEK
uniref:Uncharacterized protein n=1 Tax=viral metagenome TaxID=1070528 RepID=A0A6M3XNX4_9ZZZZ